MEASTLQDHDGETELRLAILQRVCTPYRVSLFRELAALPGMRVRLFIGADVPGSKVRSAQDLAGIDVEELPSRFLRVGNRTLVHHRGLSVRLKAFRPHVILSEGESNLVSYFSAMRYRWRHPGTGLVHWSLGGLPGEPMVRRGMRGRLVNALRRHFDAFVVYSSYGREVLLANGFDDERIFVAVNVSDLSRHISAGAGLSQAEARRRLGIDDRFTVLFVGAMTLEKRLDVLLEAAAGLDPVGYHVIWWGMGRCTRGLPGRSGRGGCGTSAFQVG